MAVDNLEKRCCVHESDEDKSPAAKQLAESTQVKLTPSLAKYTERKAIELLSSIAKEYARQ